MRDCLALGIAGISTTYSSCGLQRRELSNRAYRSSWSGLGRVSVLMEPWRRRIFD